MLSFVNDKANAVPRALLSSPATKQTRFRSTSPPLRRVLVVFFVVYAIFLFPVSLCAAERVFSPSSSHSQREEYTSMLPHSLLANKSGSNTLIGQCLWRQVQIIVMFFHFVL